MLNEDLCEAAALGHDLGHTPFGHAGEDVMQKCFSPDFTHYKQSLRVVEKLENDGAGLNPYMGSARRHRKPYGRAYGIDS